MEQTLFFYVSLCNVYAVRGCVSIFQLMGFYWHVIKNWQVISFVLHTYQTKKIT